MSGGSRRTFAAPIQKIVQQLEQDHRVEQENAPGTEPQVPHAAPLPAYSAPMRARRRSTSRQNSAEP